MAGLVLEKNYQYSFAENTGDAGQSKRPLRALVFSSMVLAALSWSSLSLCSSSAILSDARMDAFRGVIFGLPAWISCSFSSTYAARCLMYSSWASPLMVYLWPRMLISTLPTAVSDLQGFELLKKLFDLALDRYLFVLQRFHFPVLILK